MSLKIVNELITKFCTFKNIQVDQIIIASLSNHGGQEFCDIEMLLAHNNNKYVIEHFEVYNPKPDVNYGMGPFYCYRKYNKNTDTYGRSMEFR